MLLCSCTARLFYVPKNTYFTTLTVILVAHKLWHFEEKRYAEYANKVGLVKYACKIETRYIVTYEIIHWYMW